MNIIDKMIGTNGCFLVDGSSEATMPEGYAAYAIIVAADSTEIATLDELIAGVATELADASWEGVALSRGDFIPFNNPVVAITLTNAGDRIFCYLEPTDYVAPV